MSLFTRPPLPRLRRSACTLTALLAAALATFRSGSNAGATALPDGFQDQLVTGSLDQVVGLAEVPDAAAETTRRVLFVEQRTARVGLVVGGTVFTVGTVPGVASAENERGLLGIAVDPGWPARPWVYVQCTDGRSGHTVAISRFTLTGDLAYTGDGHLAFAAATRLDLLASLPDNASNHNGGTLRFGADGRLYASLGDDATGCPAQDSTQLVGKILRLDVSRLPAGPGGPEPYALLAPPGNPYATSPDSGARLVWTLGLRNPFRFNVDRSTGGLVISDVGENTWEEMDWADHGGMNMGWPVREGPASYTTCARPSATPFTEPIAYYDHAFGDAVIAGPRYRRPAVGASRFPAEYEGDILYLDYYDGELWRITPNGGGWVPAAPVAGQPNVDNWGTGFATTSDMIECSDGSVWFCQQFAPGSGMGEIHRIVYAGNTGVVPSPPALAIAAPWPSPSRGSVTIAWTQTVDAGVRVTIHDAAGRLVRTLSPTGVQPAGPHQATWDGLDDAGRRARSGAYFLRVGAAGVEREARVWLVR